MLSQVQTKTSEARAAMIWMVSQVSEGQSRMNVFSQFSGTEEVHVGLQCDRIILRQPEYGFTRFNNNVLQFALLEVQFEYVDEMFTFVNIWKY